MIPIGSILKVIGGAAGAGLSIANNKAERERLEKYYEDEDAKLEAQKSQLALSDAATSAALSHVDDATRKAVAAANGRSKITGDFSGAEIGKAQEAGMEARAGVIENSLEYDRKHNDALEAEQRKLSARKNAQMHELAQQKGQAIQNMVSNAFESVGAIAGDLAGGAAPSGAPKAETVAPEPVSPQSGVSPASKITSGLETTQTGRKSSMSPSPTLPAKSMPYFRLPSIFKKATDDLRLGSKSYNR